MGMEHWLGRGGSCSTWEWVPCFIHSPKSCFYTDIITRIVFFNVFVFVRKEGRKRGTDKGRVGEREEVRKEGWSKKENILESTSRIWPGKFPTWVQGTKNSPYSWRAISSLPADLSLLWEGTGLSLRTIQGLKQTSCCYAEPCTSSRCYTFFKHLI